MSPSSSSRLSFWSLGASAALSSLQEHADDNNQNKRNGNPLWKTLAPASLLGGAMASMYASLFQSSQSTTLTPHSAVYMFLLALQYSVQPRLSKRFISPQISKQHVALVEELTKVVLGLSLYFLFAKSSSPLFQHWSLRSSLVVAGLPALLYALQGVLQYTSYQHLDSVTFNGLAQLKTLSAALSCYWLLNKPQSPLQIFSLFILLLSSLLFQANKTTTATNSSKLTTSNTFLKGVLPCLGATFVSGLAGALSQKGLQWSTNSHAAGRDAFLFTAEVSAFSALTLIGTSRLQQRQLTTTTTHQWRFTTLIPIVAKAMGGVLTVLVHKHAGSVTKGFALMLGLVFSGLWEIALGEQDNFQWQQWIGTLLVLWSGWMHVTHPPIVAAP